jgi:hypothetical protein
MKLLIATASHLEIAAGQYVRAAARLRRRGLDHTASALERLAAKQQRAAEDLARAGRATTLVLGTARRGE